MKEKFEQSSFDDLRLEEAKRLLSELKVKRPIEDGSIVTILTGPYKMYGLKVIEIDGNMVRLSPSPESPETFQADISEIFDVADFADAFQIALKKYPIINKEGGSSNQDWQNAMLN